MDPERVLRGKGAPILDYGKIAALLAENALAVCRDYLLTSGKKVGKEWKCGDVRNNPGGSLAVTLWGEDAGLWYDQAYKTGGNLLQLIAAQYQVGLNEAAEIALEILSLSPEDVRRAPRPPAVRQKSAPVIPTEAPENVRKLWQSSVPVDGSHGRDYLMERGIVIPPPPTIRFNPSVPYWHPIKGREKPVCLGRFPALICGVAFWPNLTVVALQRIYLDPRLPAKVKLPDPENPGKFLDPKKTLGAFKGGAVRLSPYDNGRLALAEGVETALTVLQYRPGFAVWATLGTTGMAEVLVPKGGSKLLCIDNDEPGVQAAAALIRRINGPGEDIGVTSEKIDGADFNDIISKAS